MELEIDSTLLSLRTAEAQHRLESADPVAQVYERLKALGLPVECGSGGLTKFNRITRGLPKTHWLDAACVGKSTPEQTFTKLYNLATDPATPEHVRDVAKRKMAAWLKG